MLSDLDASVLLFLQPGTTFPLKGICYVIIQTRAKKELKEQVSSP